MKRLDITIQQKESVLNTECRPVLVGGGTDGASVNVGIHSGMKSRRSLLGSSGPGVAPTG